MRRFYLWGAVTFLIALAVGLGVAQERGTSSSAASSPPPAAVPASSSRPASSASSAPATPVASSSVGTKAATPVQVGQQLYAANCQTCHGKNGQGGKYRGVRGANRISLTRFKRIILYGAERMPGYAKTGLSTSNSLGKLGSNGYLGNSKAPTDQQIQDLLAYLKTLPGASRGGFYGGDD